MKLTKKQALAAGIPWPEPQKAPGRARKGQVTPEAFAMLCKAHGLPEPTPEWRFHPTRKWRFDWVFLNCRFLHGVAGHVALEVDGGAWVGGRHTRGAGFIKDQEKLNEAALRGWLVLRCTPADIKSGAVFDLLKRAMEV